MSILFTQSGDLLGGFAGLKPRPIAQPTLPYVLPTLTDKLCMENWRGGTVPPSWAQISSIGSTFASNLTFN